MIERDAHLSECQRYRYTLGRTWDKEKPFAVFIGLNPSTADATKDDPTIRRCMTFAQDWGYGGLWMVNLFAFRATDPKDMMKARDPVGPINDGVLAAAAEHAGVVVAAWGAHGVFQKRDEAVREFLPRLHYLRLTKGGHPGHPLYLPKTLRPVPWGSDDEL